MELDDATMLASGVLGEKAARLEKRADRLPFFMRSTKVKLYD